MGYRVTFAGKNARGNAPPLPGFPPGWFFGNYIYIYVWFVVGLSWRCGDWLEVDDLDRYLLLIG